MKDLNLPNSFGVFGLTNYTFEIHSRMEAQLKHASLNATLKGVRAGNVQHFRGVPYAHIPARFARSEPLDDWQGKEVECTDFG